MKDKNKGRIFFAHGKESGPWGAKIRALAEVAKEKQFAIESPDYSTTSDPDQRVKQLLQLKPQGNPLVLVGSSMGAWVSLRASHSLTPQGIFLLAPAVYVEGFPEMAPPPNAPFVEMIHGWKDEIVPVEKAYRFAQKYESTLHLLPSTHRLTDQIPEIKRLFDQFLHRILLEK